MRLNLPVTGHEYDYPQTESLVSTTDLKGRLLYVNPAFIEVSGFRREELLGQPHNLIRHPDMPAEAFRDLWATIEKGLPWSGLVVNRRKNGDAYWVMANVTPLLDDGAVSGYLSVRTKPEREAVEAARTLYATMRAEAEQGRLLHRLQAGRVLRLTGLRRVCERLRPDLGTQLTLSAAALAAAGLLAGHLESLLAMDRATSLGVGAVTLAALTALGSWQLRRAVITPLRGMVDAANRMAAGDLRQRIRPRGLGLISRLAVALQQLNVNLAAMAHDTHSGSEAMRRSLAEIAEGNQDLSARTESQAASLQQTAASMEQISGSARHSADGADEAARLAQQACSVTERGNATTQEMTATMQAIRDASDRIAEINRVIDGIAFQTNILALNAAVEAARAGEHGRGFAVVASEVRALAGRASSAAREVRTLIEDSAAKVQDGARLAGLAQQTLQESVGAVRRVGDLVGQISGAAHEQQRGIAQISEAMAQIDTITQHNAALVEQVAAATGALTAQAGALTDTVGIFKLTGVKSDATPDAVALRRRMKAAAKPTAAAAAG